MNRSLFSAMTGLHRWRLWGLLLLGSLLGNEGRSAAEADLKLQAVLVWGTNGARPKDAELKDLSEDVCQKLRAVFRWQDYYEVNRKALRLPTRQTQKVRLSPKCEIAVENLGRSTVEVKLYGEGKFVVKKRQVLTPGELLVLAGEDRNDTAWFVVLNADPD